jgi:hypothetical protein
MMKRISHTTTRTLTKNQQAMRLLNTNPLLTRTLELAELTGQIHYRSPNALTAITGNVPAMKNIHRAFSLLGKPTPTLDTLISNARRAGFHNAEVQSIIKERDALPINELEKPTLVGRLLEFLANLNPRRSK